MAYKIPNKKKPERKTKVGDLIVRDNMLYKVVGKKKINGENMLELKPFTPD